MDFPDFQMSLPGDVPMPQRFADLKRALLPADDEGKKKFVQAWEDVLAALKAKTKEVQNAKDTSEVSL